jgi:hypothetical protein
MSKEFGWFTETPLRRVLSVAVVVAATALLLSLAGCSISEHKDEGSGKKDVEIKTPFGDMNVKNRADAKDTGLPLYPGATLKPSEKGDEGKGQAQVSLDMFGMKIAVVSYLSNDAPDKVVAWYRNELKPMGTFVECASSGDIGNVGAHYDTKDSDSEDKLNKPVSCEHADTGGSRKVTQLKMGTEGNQRIVAVGDRKDGKPGSEFALVRVIIGKHTGETL